MKVDPLKKRYCQSVNWPARSSYRFCLLFILGFLLIGCGLGGSEKPLPVNRALGGEFTLQSTSPGVSGVQDFAGKVVLLNFGFTSCPDICPMVLARLKQLVDQLGDKTQAVQVAFVTVDPTHDTVEVLEEYLQFFSANFVGFSGTESQIHEVARLYGAVIMPEETEEPDQRRFSHSDFVYLIDQQGRIRKLYATDDSLQQMKQDVESLLLEESGLLKRLSAWF